MAHILVADDDVEQVTLQQRILQTIGHQVDTALSPAEAIRQLETGKPSLMVMDLRFPVVADGLALIRAIRQLGYNLPIIVLSGWPDDIYCTPEEQMVSRILVKGSIRELMKTIDEVLAA